MNISRLCSVVEMALLRRWRPCDRLQLSVKAKAIYPVESYKQTTKANKDIYRVYFVLERFRCLKVHYKDPGVHACSFACCTLEEKSNAVPAKKEIIGLCWGTAISGFANALWYTSYPLQAFLIWFLLLPSLQLSTPLSTCVSSNSRGNRITFICLKLRNNAP